MSEIELIRWKKGFRRIHSHPEEKRQQILQNLVVLMSRRIQGGAGELLECYKVLARVHGQPSCLFKNRNLINNIKII